MGNPTVTPLVEQWHDGGFIVSVGNGHQFIDQMTLTGGVKVLPGTVLGQVTTSGKFAPLNLSATDGTQTAAGILYAGKDVTAADRQAAVVLRQAEVNTSELVWPAGITQPQIAAALAQLKAIGVIGRPGAFA